MSTKKKTSALADLLAQKAALEQRILAAQREHKAEAIRQVRVLMNEYGLTMTDIAARPVLADAPRKPPAATGEGGPAPAAAPTRRKAPAGTARKVAPKYRDAATGDTWTGRGLQPRWLRERLANGRTLAEFTI
jgi:DNA-binding protein H-NS